jgi:hypothetical protein
MLQAVGVVSQVLFHGGGNDACTGGGLFGFGMHACGG